MKVFLLTLALALSVAAASSLAVHAQKSEQFRAWNQPVEPFRIIGNVYYVGSNEIGVYLITGEDGHILLDGGFEETVDQILANIRTLGFETGDVEILLNSHAHLDHAGGLARLKKETGARLCIMEGDVSAIESGQEGSAYEFPAVPVDCRLQPNEIVELGETRLTAHHTPGHTRGCTTWSMVVTEGADQFDVVFVGSPNVLPDMPLVGNPDYPEIAKDFSKAFATLSSLECDVFLGAHGSYFFLERKIEEMREGNQANPFIDPEHYQDFVKRKAAIFEKKLEEAESKNARESAREFIRREQGLVYGGGNIGLMGVLADEVLAGGGHVTGVIPEALARRELTHQGIQDLRVVPHHA